MRGDVIKKRDIELDIARLLDEQMSLIKEKEDLLQYSGSDFARDESGKQAASAFRQKMLISVNACNEFLSSTDGLAEALAQ